MQILSSGWLQRMVMKSASSPEARIANLFAILQDWLDAPGMRTQMLSSSMDSDAHRVLNAFLLTLVSDAKFDAPERLAFQLYFILLGALNEEDRNPGSNAMTRAGEAAASLIAAAKPPLFNKRDHIFAIASVAVAAFVTVALLMPFTSGQPAPVARIALQAPSAMPVSARPDRLATLYQLNEKIRSGQCSYPQALMLAAEQRAAFMEGVVNIDTLNTATTNLDEVIRLYDKVDCSYTPGILLL